MEWCRSGVNIKNKIDDAWMYLIQLTMSGKKYVNILNFKAINKY